jgi:pterin-4a-carbinolamine dehydratase
MCSFFTLKRIFHLAYSFQKKQRIEIEIKTHAIDGLSENDFILAAKIDDI